MAADRSRILVADDDPAMRLLLRRTLELAQWQVVVAEDGATALTQAQREPFDLLVLDIMMPGLDGLEITRRVRATSTVPIMLLTVLDSEEDVIRGLEAGADDYLAKPFAAGALLARVRATLRRTRLNAAPPVPPVRTGRLVVDVVHETATMGGRDLALTPIERRLLVSLARHLGRIQTFEHLYSQIWGPGNPTNRQLLQVTMSRLRQKIESERTHHTYIQTLKGVGYVLNRLPIAP